MENNTILAESKADILLVVSLNCRLGPKRFETINFLWGFSQNLEENLIISSYEDICGVNHYKLKIYTMMWVRLNFGWCLELEETLL